MIIDCISDLHGEEPELDGGDLLIIAGDLTASDKMVQYERLFFWLEDLTALYEKIVVIAGNHDGKIQEGKWTSWPLGVVYLQDSSTDYQGFKIYGSPWTPTFQQWHFMKNRGPSIREVWDKIPLDTNILVTHGPPFGILDQVKTGRSAGKACGCDDLHARLADLKQLKLHVYGHIHSARGRRVFDWDLPGVQFVNASVLDEDYDMVFDPIRIVL
jgi:Icc-related predicted phosphoesterase